MREENPLTILFVDDEESVISSLKRFLRKEDFHALYANSGREALDLIAREPVHILVTDLRMPGMSGLELIEEVKTGYPEILRLVASATRDIEQTVESINTGGIFRFITKPFDPHLFKSTIQNAVNFYRLRRDRETLLEELSAANAALLENNKMLDTAYRDIVVANLEQERMQRQAAATEQQIAEHLLQAKMPEIDGVSLAALAVPAKNIAGDFYECVNYGNRSFDLLIGDVMGKGSLPALIGAALKGLFLKTLSQLSCKDVMRVNCPHNPPTNLQQIEVIISRLHEVAISRLFSLETYATLCFARFNLNIRQMSYVDCGHTRTIHFRPSYGSSQFLSGDAPPLGVIEKFDYCSRSVELQQGDVFLFYSDGISEAENDKGEEFGERNLARLIEQFYDLPVAELVGTIHSRVLEHTGQSSLDDDFTCVAVKIDH